MVSIPSWLRGADVLGAIQGGSDAGMRLRQLAVTQQAQQAQQALDARRLAATTALESTRNNNQQGEAAARLKYSYDALAQADMENKRRLFQQQQQQQAVNALRGTQLDNLSAFRQSEADNQSRRSDIAEKKSSASEALKKAIGDDIPAFYKDVQDFGLSTAIQKHPLAMQEPGIRSQVAKTTFSTPPPSSAGRTDLTIPGTTTTTPGMLWGTNSETSPSTTLHNVPLDSPLVNKFGSPELAAIGGTNLVRRPSAALLNVPSAAAPANPAQPPKNVITFVRDKDGNLVPATDDADSR